MSTQTTVSGSGTGGSSAREIFQCYCGQRFEDREPLDEHLERTHPEMLVKCNDCQRLLPKGVWEKLANENVIALVPPR
jgi:hypothetical protein